MQRDYEHTQHSPLWLVLALPIAAGLVTSAVAEDAGLRYAAVGFAALFAWLVASFATLTVRDVGDRLDVRFGPLPLFGTKVRYADVEGVEVARSRLIDGWGIHWVPGRGWTFNLWGFDCVEVTTPKGIVRIGTDEPEELARFLAHRVAVTGTTPG